MSMCKELLAVLLTGLVVVIAGDPYAVAQAKDDRQGQHTSQVKTEVRRLGTGESSRVNVELYDKTKLLGSIVEIGEDQFVLRDARPARTPTLSIPV
jgi:hypothetical protein